MYKSHEELQKEALKLFNSYKDKELSVKERTAIPQQDMPAQDPFQRRENFNEVATGYTAEQVRVEAMRCLDCKNAPCIKGCPVEIDIPRFVKAAERGNFSESIKIIKESSILPAMCGRVCPQETQCMELCTVGKIHKDVMKSVAIGRIERFAADWEREHGKTSLPKIEKETGKKVAIVGSGPSGLTAAVELRRHGHRVTLFEAFHKPGGVTIYGIPEFRLPKAILKDELSGLTEMGVEINTNFLVGRTRKVEDLIAKDHYDAVYIATGAGLPKFLGIEGEHFVGVYSASEFLTRVNLMKAYHTKAATPLLRAKKVAVFGGGNVAMDAARTALRLDNTEEVHLIYRRTRSEMPARVEEVDHAEEEGVIFNFLTNPTRILGDENGMVKAIECLKYELGDPDESGRRSPVPIPGSEFIIEIDCCIPAIGNSSNPLIQATTPEIEFNKRGNIVVDDQNKTSMDSVYAGGDIVQGAATVILAMGDGKRAAESINKVLL